MHDKNYVVIGKNIKRFRKQNYYSQEKLAELLEISTNHLYRIEKAKSHISLQLLFKITDIIPNWGNWITNRRAWKIVFI